MSTTTTTDNNIQKSKMGFSHQTRGTIAQILHTIPEEAAKSFILKHLGVIAWSFSMVIADATQDQLQSMITELLTHNQHIQHTAKSKGAFHSGVEELERWVLHDGWRAENGELIRITPAAEEITGVRDKLLEDIKQSGLDVDGGINEAINKSSTSFTSAQPDFNGSITNVRIALENVAIRSAEAVAKKAGEAKSFKWGAAVQCLRNKNVILKDEEDVLTTIYTFISQSAHTPKGLSEEEWARLARTYGLSSVYFILRKYIVNNTI
jgi:hypothetical protein